MKDKQNGIRMRLRGITGRWATNTLLVTAVILLVLITSAAVLIINYYRSSVATLLSGYANENVTTFFSPYVGATADTFTDKSKEFIDSFADKGLMEVQVLDKNGNVVASSSGFTVTDTAADMEDVALAKAAANGVGRATFFNKNGEHVMAVSMLLPQQDETFSGAVRFLTSMKNLDRQMVAFIIFFSLVYILALFFVFLSGIFFVRTIVTPVRSINDTVKRFAGGEIGARVENVAEKDDEISDLAQSINGMIDAVNETDKLKNDFISTVSHELRTPLTAINGWGEMLRDLDGEDRELGRRGIEVIINESERLTQLVEELLDFSHMQNGKFSLRLEKIDVLAELDEAIFVFKERSKRDGIELRYAVPETPVPMMADQNRIKQVFVNILDNAFKYNHSGGFVNVEAECGDCQLTLRFTDNGCGISAEDLPNVKKKFYKTNLQVRGSGIGLAVVDEIVKLHNGEFTIESELGVGTTVTIVFPTEPIPQEPTSPLAEQEKGNPDEQTTECR